MHALLPTPERAPSFQTLQKLLFGVAKVRFKAIGCPHISEPLDGRGRRWGGLGGLQFPLFLGTLTIFGHKRLFLGTLAGLADLNQHNLNH